MTEEELAAIRERAKAATHGPWKWEDWDEDNGPNPFSLTAPPETRDTYSGTMFPNLRNRLIHDDEHDISEADREFIAHARQDIPALLEEIRRLNIECAVLQTKIDSSSFQYQHDVLEVEEENGRLIDRRSELQIRNEALREKNANQGRLLYENAQTIAALREIVEALLLIDWDDDGDAIYYVDGQALANLQAKARALLGKSPEEVG